MVLIIFVITCTLTMHFRGREMLRSLKMGNLLEQTSSSSSPALQFSSSLSSLPTTCQHSNCSIPHRYCMHLFLSSTCQMERSIKTNMCSQNSFRASRRMSNVSLNSMVNRLLYRSKQRGFLELDIILVRY